MQLEEGKWLFDSEAGVLQALPALPEALAPMWRTLASGAPVRQPIRWVASHLGSLTEHFELPPGPDSAASIRLIPANPRFQCHLDGSQRQIQAKISLLYPHVDDRMAVHGSSDAGPRSTDGEYPIQDQNNRLVFYTRNFPAEFASQRLIQSTGFLQTNIPNTLELKGEREVLHFLSSDLQKLQQKFEVTQGDGFRNLASSFAVIRPHIKVPRKPLAAGGVSTVGREPAHASQDWLTLEVAYEA